MKRILTLTLLATVTAAAYAQPKTISQATINTTTNVIAPEEDEVSSVQNSVQGGPGGGGMGAMFRNFGDGETKSTTYIKDGMVKTVLKSDMGRSTIIRDNSAKKTTTLIEMMGKKTGFFVTDEEQAAMRVRMDSMMRARRKDTTTSQRANTNAPNPAANVEVAYTEQTKKIAGYTCKRAYVISTRLLGLKDSLAVWYSPEIKLQDVASTGGLSAFGNMGAIPGLDKVDGFVMAYERKMPRGRLMTVEVTKIDINKEVAAKEFEIPKDFEIKPMAEMQGMFGGGAGGGMQIIQRP